jgi:hypothetical protein
MTGSLYRRETGPAIERGVRGAALLGWEKVRPKKTGNRQLRLFLAASVAAVALSPALAQDSSPGRFSVTPAEQGFIRLDTRTGATTHCTQRDGVWTCHPVIEDVGQLTETLRALDDRVDALAANLAEPSAEDAAAEGGGLASAAIERLMDFVRILKHGRPGEV